MSINKEFRVKHGLISEDDVTVNGSVTATSFIGDGSQLTGISSFSGNYNDLTNKPILFSGSYNDLTDKPTLFSGNYNDLTNKPTIPSLTGYATESYVQTQVANLVDSAPTTLDTLNELAAALADDPNFATTISTELGLKANTSSLATVAFSGSYSDLTSRPNQDLNTTSDVTFNNLSLTGNITSGLTVVNPSSPYTVMSIKGDSTYTGVGGGQLKITNAAGTRFLEAGYNSSTLTGFLQVFNQGYSGPLMLNPDGGDVIIGADGSTTNIRTVLSLNGSTGISGQVLKSNGNAKPSWLTLSTVATTGSYNDLLDKPNLSTLTSVDTLQFNTAYAGGTAVGQVSWNSGDGTLDVGLLGGNVVLQVGQEQVQRIKNNTGATLLEGQAVVIAGAQGQRLTVNLAQANAESTSSKTFGVVTENIANEAEGYITTEGLVRNINTSAYPEGAALWLSPTTPGGITTTKPVAPNHLVLIGFCVRQHATAGSIFVKVQNGYELNEIHDVLINGKQDGDVLKYDDATGVWKNSRITSVDTLSSLRVSGSTNLGTNTYNKTTIGSGDLAMDNGTNDTPGLLLYYANNKNWGIDSFTANGLQALRFVNDLNESTGSVKAYLDTDGKLVANSFAGDGSQLTNISVLKPRIEQRVVSYALTQGNSYANWVDLTDFNVTITPQSINSKILVQLQFGALSQSTNAIVFRLVRNGSVIAFGDASSSRPQATVRSMREGDANHTRAHPTINYLDSPNTISAVTYKIQWMCEGSATIYVNRAQNDTDNQSYGARTISTLIAQEFLG